MPDFERVLRQLEIDMADNDRKLAIKAYHMGLDRARKEIAVIVAVATITFILLRIWV